MPPAPRRPARRRPRPDELVIRDPAAIKALAHPARLSIMDELMEPERQATATELAEKVGLSPSALSYHLRELAKWKIVVPAESADGRERRWRINPGGFSLEPDNPVASQAAENSVVGRILDRYQRGVLDWIRSPESREPPWDQATSMLFSTIWLTADEMVELTAAYEKMLEKYRDDRSTETAPTGARRVQMTYMAVPVTGSIVHD